MRFTPPAAAAAPTLEVVPRDLSAYRQGNCGVDYVHRFESGQPGPHVLATQVTMRFVAHFGLIDRYADATPAPAPQRRFELLQTHVTKDQNFHFVRRLIGFETLAKGKCIAIDGADEIRAPCDDCTVFMPARTVIVGREAVYLTRPMP